MDFKQVLPGSDQETSSDSKTLQSKLLINNADITGDTEIVCSYDSNHVSTVTTLDVIGTIFLIVPVLFPDCLQMISDQLDC